MQNVGRTSNKGRLRERSRVGSYRWMTLKRTAGKFAKLIHTQVHGRQLSRVGRRFAYEDIRHFHFTFVFVVAAFRPVESAK